MSKTAELETYLNNPNVQAFLGMLREAEHTEQTGNPYQTRFGGKVDPDLDLNAYPTFVYKNFKQTDGKINKSGATGAYQFLKATWAGLAQQYGFKDFSPKTQDLGAIALLKQNGALPLILKGDYQGAVRKANKTWASLPGSPYAQRTRDDKFIANALAKHSGQEIDFAKYDDPKSKAVTSTLATPITAATTQTSTSPKTETAKRPTLWGKIKSIFRRT